MGPLQHVDRVHLQQAGAAHDPAQVAQGGHADRRGVGEPLRGERDPSGLGQRQRFECHASDVSPALRQKSAPINRGRGRQSGMVTIRPQTLDDIPAVSALHVRAWQAGYAGIVPAEVPRRDWTRPSWPTAAASGTGRRGVPDAARHRRTGRSSASPPSGRTASSRTAPRWTRGRRDDRDLRRAGADRHRRRPGPDGGGPGRARPAGLPRRSGCGCSRRTTAAAGSTRRPASPRTASGRPTTSPCRQAATPSALPEIRYARALDVAG